MINRRNILKKTLLYSLAGSLVNLKAGSLKSNNINGLIRKKIPGNKETIPAVGMGTWLTFDVGHDKEELNKRVQILEVFFKKGGTLIDSSPMYGRAERVVGKCLEALKDKKYSIFSASKIWTPNGWHGKKQFENSLNLWNLNSFSLMQVHNLVNCEGHLEYLYDLKKRSIIKYIGVTTSHGWRHEKLKSVMETYDIDFVQLTYNIFDTEAEKKLLPLAFEKNIAVIANRPFQGGNLFKNLKNKKLPSKLKQYEIKNWADFFLKFIISHPAVTCAIPATSQVNHMYENMKALEGFLLTEKERSKIKEIFEEI